MRVLGIDIGLKRTGLALSDEQGLSVTPLPQQQFNSRAALLEKILGLLQEFSVEVILIGCPEQKTVGSKAIHSRAHGLKDILKEQLKELNPNIRILIVDEAHSSKRAMQNLIEAEVPQKKRKTLLDAASAAVLVQDYLREN